MNDYVFEIIVICGLIFINGVFAMSELAIVSAKKIRLQHMKEAGRRSAGIALELSNNHDRLLPTVQIGITLVGIFAGAFGGATLAQNLATWFKTIPWIYPHQEAAAIFIVVGSITYLSLIIGELVPKRIALRNAETIACWTAPLMNVVSIIGAPLVFIMSVSTNTVLKIFRIGPSTNPAVTDEEVSMIVEEGAKAGIFEETEKDMVKKVLQLDDRPVSLVMTNRTDIVWYNTQESPEENWKSIIISNHGYFPVCDGDINKVLGMGSIKRALSHNVTLSAEPDMNTLSKPVYVPITVPILDVLELFKSTGQKHALVVDEYGSTRGLVTFYDIAEAIIGEVELNVSDPETDILKQEDNVWLVGGSASLDELQETIGGYGITEVLPQDIHTLAGYIFYMAEHIPNVGEKFTWEKWNYTIVSMDRNQIIQVRIDKS